MERPLSLEELLRHSGWLRTLARRLVADPGGADDLVQETWLAALRRPPRATGSLRPWLARVARNLARNAHRAEARRSQREELAGSEQPTLAPHEALQEAEAQRLVAEAVTRLPEPLRVVIVLHYFRALDSRTIAAELSLSPSAVRTRLQRALEELRAELDRGHGGERSTWRALLAPLAARAAAVPAGSLLGPGLALLGVLGLATAIGLARYGLPSAHELSDDISVRDAVDASADLRQATPAAPRAPGPGGARQQVLAQQSTASSAEDGSEVELAGVVLVDGAPPRWALELVLDGPRPAATGFGPASAASAGPARAEGQFRTLEPEQGGRFSFGRLPAGWSGRLTVLDHRCEDGRASLALAAPQTDLVLRVRSGPALSGRYLDARAEPIDGAWGFCEVRWAEGGGELDSWSGHPFRTAPDGSFRVPLEGQGRAGGTLLLESDGRAYARTELAAFSLEVGRELGLLEAEPVRKVLFHARDSALAPLPGVFARVGEPFGLAFGDDYTRRCQPTDAQGVGTIAWVPEGDARLRFSAFRYAEQSLLVSPGTTPEVVLTRLAVLLVEFQGAGSADARLVLRANAQPYVWADLDGPAAREQQELGAARPERTQDEGRVLEFAPGGEGRFTLVGLRPGVELTLEGLDEGGRSLAVRTTVLAEGEWARLVIPLELQR